MMECQGGACAEEKENTYLRPWENDSRALTIRMKFGPGGKVCHESSRVELQNNTPTPCQARATYPTTYKQPNDNIPTHAVCPSLYLNPTNDSSNNF